MTKITRSTELAKDIFAYAVLLTRFGYEKCVTNQTLFVEMLNEATDSEGNPSFRTVSGKRFTKQSLHVMLRRLPAEIIAEIKQEFSETFSLMAHQGQSILVSDYSDG